MPVAEYSVLKATPIAGAISDNSRPHYLISAQAAGVSWQIAVNVESESGQGTGAQVLYALDENWTPPYAGALEALPMGITSLTGTNGNPAIDYLRSRASGLTLITRAQMQLLPLPGKTASENLKNAVISYLEQAVKEPGGLVYAFGSRYTNGNGVHDIHMNQGNPARDHGQDNGTWQDGLLVFSMPGESRWTAVYLAFQDQVWMTDLKGDPA